MIRLIIIDDEFDARQILTRFVKKYGKGEFIIVGESDEVEGGAKLVDSLKPDFIFLDLHLYNESGFDLLNKVKFKNFKTIIVSAYENYGIQAVKSGAFDYLLKPINPLEFKSCLEKIKKNSAKINNYDASEFKIKVPSNNFKLEITINEILLIKADSNYSKVILVNGKVFHVSKTLRYFDDLLSEKQFFRSHQSFLINLRHVIKFNNKKGTLEMRNDIEALVSRRNKNDLVQAFYRFKNN